MKKRAFIHSLKLYENYYFSELLKETAFSNMTIKLFRGSSLFCIKQFFIYIFQKYIVFQSRFSKISCFLKFEIYRTSCQDAF